MTTFAELGLSAAHAGVARPPRLRAPDADPGADDPTAARGPRRDRPGPDRHRQDRRLRPADGRVRRPDGPGRAGARAHADARALHPGHPGAARLRRAPRAGASWRCSAAPRSATRRRASRTGPDRGGHRRARDGHDRPPPPVPRPGPLRGARRGRRDARPRLPRGRGVDPAPLPDGTPDRALQRDGAARDPPPGGHLHARPGRDQGARRHAHDRHRGPLLRRGARPREARGARARAAGRAAPPGDRVRAHEDRRRPARRAGWATPACASRRCTATCRRASATA